MRIIAFDHFFGQDLDALDGALAEGDALIRIPYRRWHRAAQKCFPDVAFQELSRPFRGDLEHSWTKYQKFVDDEVNWLIAVHQPNLLVLPSDIFFYVRPFVETFRRYEISTFVMQKETTISPDVMDVLSIEVGRFTPFISDFMSVCSQRHKDFWVKAGADSHRIAVTGQPRFDLYVNRGVRQAGNKPRLLYLSYDDVAYLPSDGDEIFDGSWRDLRLQTEYILNQFSDNYEVFVKEHPQQANAESALGRKVKRVDRYADTRHLILDADLVIGFQTTALYEAAICGKPVIYPAWGEVFDSVRETLCNFEEIPSMVNWAGSPDAFRALLDAGPGALERPGHEAVAEALVHLGPIDGNCSNRTLDLMVRFSSPSPKATLTVGQFVRRLPSAATTPFFFVAWLLTRTVAPSFSVRLGRRKNESWAVMKECLRGLRQVLGLSNGL